MPLPDDFIFTVMAQVFFIWHVGDHDAFGPKQSQIAKRYARWAGQNEARVFAVVHVGSSLYFWLYLWDHHGLPYLDETCEIAYEMIRLDGFAVQPGSALRDIARIHALTEFESAFRRLGETFQTTSTAVTDFAWAYRDSS